MFLKPNKYIYCENVSPIEIDRGDVSLMHWTRKELRSYLRTSLKIFGLSLLHVASNVSLELAIKNTFIRYHKY